ncbi:MAG: uroporphyrinogen decarboxylase family protein, partial [Armatimonadota bacterium]
MTSRARILEAIRGGSPDRVPVSPFTLGALDYSSAMAQELIAKTDPFLRTTGGMDPFVGSAVAKKVAQDGDTTITTLLTPKGELTTRWRQTNITEATVEYGIKTLDDAQRFLSMPYSCDGISPNAYYKWRSRIRDEGLVLVEVPNAICLPAQWLSPEDFCMWTMDYPDLLLELTRVGSKRINEYVDRLCRAGVEAFRIIGGEYAVTQLGPTGFDKLVAPFDAELVDVIHSHGATAYYHCHGCVSSYIDRLANIGMDALDPLEAAPWGDTDIGEA